jgi:hypothetical protein
MTATTSAVLGTRRRHLADGLRGDAGGDHAAADLDVELRHAIRPLQAGEADGVEDEDGLQGAGGTHDGRSLEGEGGRRATAA